MERHFLNSHTRYRLHLRKYINLISICVRQGIIIFFQQLMLFLFLNLKSFIQFLFFTIFMFTFSILPSVGVIRNIDIKSLQNRLLKVCYVPATSACLPRVSFLFSFLFLLLRPLTVLMKQTRQAVCTIKQSIFLDVYD